MTRPFVLQDVNLRLWQLFILSYPFYLLPSGLPRISDVFIVAIVGRLLMKGSIELLPGAKTILKWLWIFVGYVFLVNAVFAFYLTDFFAVQTSLFYIDNALAVTVAFILYSQYRERFLTETFNALALCVTIQCIAGLRDLGNPARATIFFNNPNQLGYFALIASSLLVYLSNTVRVRSGYVTLFILMCLILALVSLSKAAILGFLFLFALHSIRQPVVLIVSVLAVFAVNAAAPGLLTTFERAQARIESIGSQGDDSAEGRGYGRIIDNPQYLSFGSSEGQTSRWTRFGAQEVHSIFGTLVFAYGIPGSLILSIFLYFALRGQGWNVFPMFAIASYGLTHQGLRFTLLWCLIAVSWCVTHALHERRRASQGNTLVQPALL